jgi:hypothetical protein
MYTFKVKNRLGGRVSWVQVQANDSGHAKRLVQAQYGSSVTVLQTKKM